MARKKYTLTVSAEADLRTAKSWSLSRWDKALTKQYFSDLHEGANYIADNYKSFSSRSELVNDTDLSVYPVREHYIVYVPVADDHIVIVSFIRQGRDLPSILRKGRYQINRELSEIRRRIAEGDITIK